MRIMNPEPPADFVTVFLAKTNPHGTDTLFAEKSQEFRRQKDCLFHNIRFPDIE